MLSLSLPGDLRTVLCLGAHSDDIEIGCGGTILQLGASRPNLTVQWVVVSAVGRRRDEAVRGAELFLGDLRHHHVELQSFDDGFFPYAGADIKRFFETVKGISPDLVFTHSRGDRHQDHRLVNELTWNTFRDHLILEYEIPKYDGDLGTPNCYVPLPEDIVRGKIERVLAAFPSQAKKPWFDEATFRALMRLRGIECRAAAGYAEAFHAWKIGLRT